MNIGPIERFILAAEQLGLRHWDALGLELERLGVRDANPVQATLMRRLGTNEMNVGDLHLTGVYTGTNVSYNLAVLERAGYIERRRQEEDRRSVLVRLSPKGLALAERLQGFYARAQSAIPALALVDGELDALRRVAAAIERAGNDRRSAPLAYLPHQAKVGAA